MRYAYPNARFLMGRAGLDDGLEVRNRASSRTLTTSFSVYFKCPSLCSAGSGRCIGCRSARGYGGQPKADGYIGPTLWSTSVEGFDV